MAKSRVPESEKKVNVAARISPKLNELLEAKAAKDDRTVSWLIEKAIASFLGEVADPARRKK